MIVVLIPDRFFLSLTPTTMNAFNHRVSGEHHTPPNKLYISLLIITTFAQAIALGQNVMFSLSADSLQQGQQLTLTNQSEQLPEGAHFCFLFQHCAFYSDNALHCTVQTTNQDTSFQGFFGLPGQYTIRLVAISSKGDTLENEHSETLYITYAQPPAPLDSCFDPDTFSCIHDNLVCNGSFEWNTDTVEFSSEIWLAPPWRSLAGHGDLFNTNSKYWIYSGVPLNMLGYQIPWDSNAYAGLSLGTPGDSLGFESIAAPLKKALLKDQRYAVEYWVSRANFTRYSSNALQVGFDDHLIQAASFDQLQDSLNPQWVLHPLGDSLIQDTAVWVRVYDVFTPDTNGLSWIMLGGLIPAQNAVYAYHPAVSNPNPPYIVADYAYQFLDQVSVRPIAPLVYLEQDTVDIMPCDSALLRVVGSGAASFLWSTGAKLDSIKVQPFQSTTYTVTVTDPEGCNTTVLSALVRILPPPPQRASIVGHNNDCDSITSYHLSQGNPQHTYVWTIPNSYGIFTATNTNTDTIYGTSPVQVQWDTVPDLPSFALIILEEYFCDELIGRDTLRVFDCCQADATILLQNDTLSDTVFTAEQHYLINGTLVINAQHHVLFDLAPGWRIFMGPEARIEIISPNTELRFDSCTLEAGCEYMWDGIYLTDSTQVFSSRASTYQDAINAVVADSGAQVEIMECVFANNLRSVVLRNFPFSYKPSIDWSGHYWPLEIHSTEFYQYGYPQQTLPYPPYDNTHSICAILLQDCDTLIIGKPSFAPNHFHDLSQGIISINSNVDIRNNQFTRVGLIEETYPPAGAIDAYRSATPGIQYMGLRVGPVGTNGLLANNFDSCSYAITLRECPANIRLNEFNNCQYGIFGLEMVGTTRISQNSLLQSSSTTLSGEDAVSLANVNPNTRAITVLVDSNYIQGYHKGIWATNLLKGTPGNIRFMRNTILFNANGSGISGIKLDNCDGSQTLWNDIAAIQRPDSGFYVSSHNGIWVNHTGAALVQGNNLLRMGNGIYTTGPDLLTRFSCNNFDSCYFGFYIGQNTSLSDQGEADLYNTLNRWMGDYSGNNCLYWRRMFQASGNLLNPVVDWYYPDDMNNIFRPGFEDCSSPQHPLISNIDEILNNSAQTDCSLDSTVYDPFSISSEEERESLLGSIVREENNYLVLDDAYHDVEKDAFLQIAGINPSTLSIGGTSDTLFQNFYSKIKSSPIGIKEQIYSLIESGNHTGAIDLNNVLGDNTSWLKTRKRVNSIYLETWCQGIRGFSLSDFDSLYNIAVRSPYAFGDAVFSARVLLGLDPDDIPLPERGNNTEQAKEQAHCLRFYPNPTNSHFCFELPEIISENAMPVLVSMFDVYGKLILQETTSVNPGERCISLKERAIPGLYLVSIWQDEKLIGRGKIIINP